MAKRMLSKKPSSHPSPTRHAVAATKTYAIEIPANRVNTNDRELINTTTAAQTRAIPAAPVDMIEALVLEGYNDQANDINTRQMLHLP